MPDISPLSDNIPERRVRSFDLLLGVGVAFLCLGVLVAAYLPLLQPEIAGKFGLTSARQDTEAASILSRLGNAAEARKYAVRALLKEPLSQDALYLVYQTGQDRVGATALLNGLSAQGWRNDAAQVTLLLRAEQRRDYKAAVDRVDALLRRDRQIADSYAVLYSLEIEPAARQAIVARLALKPHWRLDFFGSFKPVSADDVDNHIALVRLMLTRELPMDYRELSSAVNKSADFGQLAKAYDLWSAYHRGNAKKEEADNRFAPGIEKEAALQFGGTYFDWNLISGEGQDFSLVGGGDNSQLVVNWDGRGSPLLLWRLLPPLNATSRLGVVIDGDRTALDRLDFTIRCPAAAISLSFMPMGRNGWFTSQPFSKADLACPFPRLEITGAPQAIDQPVTIALQSIRLATKH